ncbi:MAG: HAMP domain-containing sensor histidine kinase [Rubrivivax sp.]
MSVRFRLALTVFLTGLATAIGVIATVVIAFQRFDHETNFQRADAFLSRVVALHDDLLAQRERNPDEFDAFLRNLLLYEPDTQLYLMDADGKVLASTTELAPGFTIALAPVRAATAAAARGDRRTAAYVMGEDPLYMEADAVVAARALQRAVIRPSTAVQGYLYLVCSKGGRQASRWALLRSSLASPALASVAAVILLSTALAAWIIVAVTRPLRVLSDDMAAAARTGFGGNASTVGTAGGAGAADSGSDDEFSRLRGGLNTMLATLRLQWDELRRLDHFRRESVSNLSHDLRSPLTATVACLETLERRWQADADAGAPSANAAAGSRSAEDARLVAVALRNTRNAAGMVRSLGDLALLDEPEFKLRLVRLDLSEVLDDITLRFADRAAVRGVALRFEQQGSAAPVAQVDVELFERAIANLLDNALKFTAAGQRIEVGAQQCGSRVRVTVSDTGSGILAADLPQLFDRLYQSRMSTAPATSEEGKGLGLAIVKRICELHLGSVSVRSDPGTGTVVTIDLPAG